MDAISRTKYDDLLLTHYLPSAPGLVRRLEDGIRAAGIGLWDGARGQRHGPRVCGIVLGRVHEALAPEGTFLMLDIDAAGSVDENLEHPSSTESACSTAWPSPWPRTGRSVAGLGGDGEVGALLRRDRQGVWQAGRRRSEVFDRGGVLSR